MTADSPRAGPLPALHSIRTLGYNDSGNTETDDTDTGALLIRGYDATDRMVSIDDGAGTAFTYLHNALGQRVAKAKTGGGTRHFLYGLSGSLTAEASGSTGANLVEYIWLDGAPLAYTKAGVVYRIHTDHLGTPQKLTHPDGTEAWSAVLRPFGGEDAVGGDVNFNLRFPGQYFDTEFDLHYNYFSNYDPNTGRYFESDPIGLRGGWNTYGYVGGNPVRYFDPRGLSHSVDDGIAIPIPTQPLPDIFIPGTADNDQFLEDFKTLCNALLSLFAIEEKCPPCKTVSGRIVPLGTIAYRPLDTPPPGKVEHGILGPHYNIYKARQAPRNTPKPCKCFWKPLGAVQPPALPPGAIPIEPFIEPFAD